eukprot:snap_masked-scaffold_91-processed-gene-0.20-mRNA-1 protein AED:1.00 eAED:1.00 QI:0/0/0/0/1/1/2/0/63
MIVLRHGVESNPILYGLLKVLLTEDLNLYVAEIIQRKMAKLKFRISQFGVELNIRTETSSEND